MRLEDIDGDLYITESLLESLRVQKPTPSSSPKYTVLISDSPVGTLKTFKSSPPLLELELDLTVDPGSIDSIASGKRVTVSGMEFGLAHYVGEIACNVETSRCTMKAIHIEEVPDERRDPDV